MTISLRTPESVPPPGPSFDGVGMLLLWTDGQPEFRFLSMDSGIGESEVGRQEWALRHLKIFFKVLLLRTKKLSQEPPPAFWKTFKDTYKLQKERSQVKVSPCIVFLFFLVNIFCECTLLQKYLEARTTNPDLFKEKKCPHFPDQQFSGTEKVHLPQENALFPGEKLCHQLVQIRIYCMSAH